MNRMILRRVAAGLLSAGLMLSFTPRARQIAALPDEIRLPAGQVCTFGAISDCIAASAPAKVRSGTQGESSLILDMLGLPVRKIKLRITSPRVVIPGGHSIGVALRTKGVLVVGVSDIASDEGMVCPARSAELRSGESIAAIDGIPVNSVNEFTKLLAAAAGRSIELTILGAGKTRNVRVTPVLDPHDGVYRLGAWVRDSTAGVGTLSFYDPVSERYGALGHAICDVDTGGILSVSDGEILSSEIVAIRGGEKGAPGELRGAFIEKALRLGAISENLPCGIYGSMYHGITNALYPDGITVSNRTLVHTGPAKLLTTLDSGGIHAYDCRITRVFRQTSPSNRSMIIKITDPELIKRTGGIVQGMSGSPLIQDDMLIGAVTHVFVNDPTQGYGIYIDWMLDAADRHTGSAAA